MSVNVLLVTHNKTGEILLDTVQEMLGTLPLQVRALAVFTNSDLAALREKIQHLCTLLDDGDGVLVLIDLFGATPGNLTNTLKDRKRVKIVYGVNLPMLIKILNYPHSDLDAMVNNALTGGRQGIMDTHEWMR